MEKSLDLFTLPEGCVSHLLSLTTPRDTCRMALVSPMFRSAAASDTVWDRFLPFDNADLLSRAADHVEFSSKRDLFFRLCDPIVIDGGKMSFFLEKSSGRKCFMVSAMQLTIIWDDMPDHWRWIQHPDSRFSKVADLLDVCWLEIHGSFDAKMLSPHTKYAAYLVYKLTDHSRGRDCPFQRAAVKVGPHESVNSVSLYRVELIAARAWPMPELNLPRRREDGWMEVELGEMEIELGEDGEVEMSLTEVKGGHWKSGLIVEGIEFRPKN